MTFEIIDGIQVPESATSHTRSRTRGKFSVALDTLQIGQGFIFDTDKALKMQYPKVSPSKFPANPEGTMSKKFKIWQEAEGKIGVKRLGDIPAANASE